MTSRIVKATEPQYLIIASQNRYYPYEHAMKQRVGARLLAEHEASLRAFGWQHITISEMAYSETLGQYVTIPE